MITAEIKMGKDYHTQVSGKTIEEVIEKIRDYHTMGSLQKGICERKGTLTKELKTGWYVKEESCM